jgi:hypothetical protein
MENSFHSVGRVQRPNGYTSRLQARHLFNGFLFHGNGDYNLEEACFGAAGQPGAHSFRPTRLRATGPVTAPKKSENADIQLSALGEKIMKVTTLILALLALALGTGTAIVVSVQTQPVVACGSPNC